MSAKQKSTLIRYIKFQLIEFIATVITVYLMQAIFEFPVWIGFAVIGIFVLKDIILYFYTWRSYIVPNPEDASLMIGKICTAVSDFKTEGPVRFNAELWKAQLIKPGQVRKGDKLHIKNIKGLKLLVDKEKSNPSF